ncbi:MAG: flagellar FliJ family protein [Hyphomonadaceae bacterium]
MKSLHTLLKVAQRRMDELGVEAAKIQQDIDAIKGKQQAILDREKQEMALAAGNSMFASMLPAYRLRVKWQIDQAQQEVHAKDEMLADVRTRLQEAYVEKSKFEQLIEQERVRTDAERAAREQAVLDELAVNRAGAAGK